MIGLLLSSPRPRRAWDLATKSFFGRGFAAAVDATRCSGSVSTATGGSAIAAPRAVVGRDSSRGAAPITGTNAAPRADWIIATGNAHIGAAGSKLA